MKEFWRVVKFVLFSISAGLIQLGSFTIFTNVFKGWSYWPCYLSSLLLSIVWNFTLNRKFTFKSAANVPVAMLKTLLFYAIFTPVTTILGEHLVKTVGWNEYIVTILNMLANFVLEFLYQRFFVFGKTIDTNVKEKNDEKA
ncbi:MAG: GtrA family protein [Clostridia bacterium]|nr:GtrA family protein [Clostridia bacterium]